MANPISVRLSMRVKAERKYKELTEQFDYLEALVLLSEGIFYSYPIEDRELEKDIFYVDILFNSMESFKNQRELFNQLEGVYFESDSGKIIGSEFLEMISVFEVAELSDFDIILYNPITLEVIH